MKLSELVSALTAELIRDGDADVTIMTGSVIDPGAVFFDRNQGEIAIMMRESDAVLAKRSEMLLRQRAQQTLLDRQYDKYNLTSVSTSGKLGSATGPAVPYTTDKHTLEALRDMMIKGYKHGV